MGFPYRFDGTFGWLSEQPSHRHNIATGAKRTLSRQWANILKESGRNEIRIPKAFADFITTSHLHPKVRSISDCYLVAEDLERFVQDRSKLREDWAATNATTFVMLDFWLRDAHPIQFPIDVFPA